MIKRRLVVFGIMLSIILAIYAGTYILLRIDKTLVHRFTTDGGNEIVIGDYNPGIHLLHPDPEASLAGQNHRFAVIRFVFTPLRLIEVLYHDLFYRYPGLTSH